MIKDWIGIRQKVYLFLQGCDTALNIHLVCMEIKSVKNLLKYDNHLCWLSAFVSSVQNLNYAGDQSIINNRNNSAFSVYFSFRSLTENAAKIRIIDLKVEAN
jgi:hypothetical protein